MKNFNAIIILLLVIIPFVNSCCKKCQDPSNSECENYDPCYGKKPVSSSFKIIEPVDGYQELWQDYETDTVAGGYVRFVADEKDAVYKWEIGAGTYDAKSFTLNFSSVPDKTTIPITLIVKKAPDKACNPNDDGIDTITRNMYISNECLVISPYKTIRFHGSFKDSPRDTFTMSFFYDSAWSYRANIDPLIKGIKLRGSDGQTGYRQYAFEDISSGIVLVGRAFIKPSDSLELYFYYQLDPRDPKTYKTFLGKKIP